MKLGFKSDVFLQHGQSCLRVSHHEELAGHLQLPLPSSVRKTLYLRNQLSNSPEALGGQIWFKGIRLCSTGLQSDITFEVGEVTFHLHKFPLLSRSSLLENLIQESSERDKKKSNFVLQLHDIPGGCYTFLLIAKFCYAIKIELTPSNIVALRCAAEYLGMNESYGERNLILETENYLNEIFLNWDDTMRGLRACEEFISYAEELNIVSRCIDSLAEKACQDSDPMRWHASGDWWYDDVSLLSLALYRRLIFACELRGMGAERIAGSLLSYAKKYLPLMSRQSSFRKLTGTPNESNQLFQTEAEQKVLLEEIVALLPDQKGIAPTKLLLKLLRICIILDSSSSCRENLEKRIGSHLYEANFEELLIPNVGYSVETLYDIDCVKRMINYFIEEYRYLGDVSIDEKALIDPRVLTWIKMVANLVDNYLVEVAPDVNLKLAKFYSIAAVIPDYAREVDDGLYRAIDTYLKAHPWLTDSERDQICRLMNSKKLSLEATTHVAQNERLPIRFISQILFIEQIRLRTSVASWYFASDKSDNSQNQSGNVSFSKTASSARFEYQEEKQEEDEIYEFVNMKDRVFELEKQCSSMKREIQKLEKSKGNRDSFFKRFVNSMSFMSCSGKSSKRLTNQTVRCEKSPIDEVD